MALQTKTFSYGDFAYQSYSNGYVLDLIVTEESVNLDNNTSSVSYRLQFRTGPNNRVSDSFPCYAIIDGQKISKTVYITAAYNHTYVLIEGKKTIPHNSDGKKALNVEGHISRVNNKYSPPDMTVKGSLALKNIPRASTVRCTDAYVESRASLTVSSASKSFTHVLKMTVGNYSTYINASGDPIGSQVRVGQGVIPVLLPKNIYAQMPNSKSATVKITCSTYNGSTKLGDSSTTLTAMAMEDRCRPSVAGTVVDVNQKTTSLTGDSNTVIRYRSTAKCTASVSTRNSATVKSVTVNGTDIRSGTAEIKNVDTGKFVFSVTDSRGFTSMQTVNKPLINYVPLTVTARVSRPSPASNEANLIVSGDFFSGSLGTTGNLLLIDYEIPGKVKKTIEVTTGSGRYSENIKILDVPYTSSFTVTVTARDLIDSVESKAVIPEGVPVFNWGKDFFRFNVPVWHGKAPIRAVQCGQIGEENNPPGIKIPPNKITEIQIDFPVAFKHKPYVAATIHVYTTSLNYYKLQLTIYDVTTTGFKIRAVNAHNSDFSPSIDWIAVEGG